MREANGQKVERSEQGRHITENTRQSYRRDNLRPQTLADPSCAHSAPRRAGPLLTVRQLVLTQVGAVAPQCVPALTEENNEPPRSR
jgi:hypothetical protein